ncbi:Cof-type HAD-IIB family hydrolase [Neobacillus sp. OS1-2]|uniref:Cof-type HAD-IIB family hydrolase n=1 Tax=Neobacillus sp. OS1-2 TaxID=3070680 RepID=UPI0027DF4ABC|nr:Cof-type HAD-IIB family hydrolase [Neobacillus sp. OS1-2]WML41721.1 Cof-type HAD-IIB family hydrolase [Neobacillus sp. OS1-2]
MIKMIASDMDGTLLNSVQQISEENRQAILKAQAQGVEFVVATGRSYQEATYVLGEAGLKCPMICTNGAEVRSIEGEILSATPIPKQLAREVAAKLTELDMYFEVYTDKAACTIDADKAVSTLADIILSANPEADRDEIMYAAGARLRDGLVMVVEDYESLFADESVQIYKMLVFSFDGRKLAAAGNALAEFPEIAVSASGDENLEVTNKQAQKGIALETFAKVSGIDISETMAIGDNYNDVSMFERAGRSVAMGNANYEIQALCDVITDTNNEHGVAKAILEVL